MWQQWVLALAVIPMGTVGGVLALSIRGMSVRVGATTGFFFVATLAIVQTCLVTSAIVRATKVFNNIRAACFHGAQAKFKPVFLLGVCVLMGSVPMAFIGPRSGAQAQFATVMLGGAVLSTAGALVALPVVIAWITN